MNQHLPSPGARATSAGADQPRNPLLCDASDWGVLAIEGDDAQSFLQAQLSSDVDALQSRAGQWTSYNSPKGRMLANGWLWRTADGGSYRLALAADIADGVRRRLSMFVLRSKVTIADRSSMLVRIGMGGPGADEAVSTALREATLPGDAVDSENLSVAGLPDGRVLLLVDAARASDLRERLRGCTVEGDADAWRRLGILAGTPLVRAATQDQLLPQEANLDALGGVALNPRKGCFPGQEIIKRTQALGQLKRRLYRFRVDAQAPAVATPLFGATFGDQACGLVVEAAPGLGGGALLLSVVQIRSAEADVLHLGAPDGPSLSPLPLTYDVTAAEPKPRSRTP